MEPCPNCGESIRATARFCTSCGYRIPERPQGSTAKSSSNFASNWIEESPGEPPEAEAVQQPTSTWPDETSDKPAEVAVTASESVYAPPAVVHDPMDDIVAATAGFNTGDDSIAGVSQNKINIAMFHIETLSQLLPDLSNWSEDRAETVNDAIAAMEAAIKGREGDDDTFYGLRETVAAAKKDPRDVDVMVALADRAVDIEDLLKAHDAYSTGIRQALIDLKPLAIEYVKMPVKRRATPARKSTRTRSTAAKTSATTAASKSASTARKSASTKSS